MSLKLFFKFFFFIYFLSLFGFVDINKDNHVTFYDFQKIFGFEDYYTCCNNVKLNNNNIYNNYQSYNNENYININDNTNKNIYKHLLIIQVNIMTLIII